MMDRAYDNLFSNIIIMGGALNKLWGPQSHSEFTSQAKYGSVRTFSVLWISKYANLYNLVAIPQ